jgi:anti-sigma factor RsiW
LRVVQSNDLLACYWLDGHMGFALAGDMARDRMMKLADEVYRQMEET